jgi:hypothetical protein
VLRGVQVPSGAAQQDAHGAAWQPLLVPPAPPLPPRPPVSPGTPAEERWAGAHERYFAFGFVADPVQRLVDAYNFLRPGWVAMLRYRTATLGWHGATENAP